MLNAFTTEMDDKKIAVSDILSQLNLDKNILPNSVGIITCNGEFIETGVLKAVCSALPFSTVGIETAASATTDGLGQLTMTISVITSDDSVFEAALSDKIDGSEENIVGSCQNASKKFGKNRKMILALCPKNEEITIIHENIFNTINAALAETPVFGGGAITAEGGIKKAKVIFNGDAFDDRFIVTAFCGKLEPKFIVRDIPVHKVVREKGLVTKTEGNLVQRVNNMKFEEFLLKSGISHELLSENLDMIPFWFDFDGYKEPISRVIFRVSQDGSGICSGNIPAGITVALGKYTKKDVLDTARKIFDDSGKKEKLNGIFLFSCIGRFVALEADLNSEMDLIKKLFAKTPCHLAYSDGEYLSDRTNKKEQNWHNFSIIGFCF